MILENTAALVTGGARRVGRAICLELAQGGCSLAVHYHRSCEDAQSLVREAEAMGRRAVAIQGDIADPASWPRIVRETVKALGRLDILINNAAVFLAGAPDTIDEFDPVLWEKTLQVNLIAAAGLCHHAREHLGRDGMGKIVNLSDVSVDRPWADHVAYCASKGGLDVLTKALAKALAPRIQVNAVALGIAAFPEEYSEEFRNKLVSRVPLRRAGTAEDAARAVRFLVEHGDYITGVILRVDGGRLLA